MMRSFLFLSLAFFSVTAVAEHDAPKTKKRTDGDSYQWSNVGYECSVEGPDINAKDVVVVSPFWAADIRFLMNPENQDHFSGKIQFSNLPWDPQLTLELRRLTLPEGHRPQGTIGLFLSSPFAKEENVKFDEGKSITLKSKDGKYTFKCEPTEVGPVGELKDLQKKLLTKLQDQLKANNSFKAYDALTEIFDFMGFLDPKAQADWYPQIEKALADSNALPPVVAKVVKTRSPKQIYLGLRSFDFLNQGLDSAENSWDQEGLDDAVKYGVTGADPFLKQMPNSPAKLDLMAMRDQLAGMKGTKPKGKIPEPPREPPPPSTKKYTI